MSLKEDVNGALAAMSAPNAPTKLALDDTGRCAIALPFPGDIVELDEGVLTVTVEVSPTSRFFTLSTPLAAVGRKTGGEFFKALLYRQFYADQVSGASFAVGGDEDVLVAVNHWTLDAITNGQFAELFKLFVSACLDLIDEVGTMAQRERNVKPLHKGRTN